MSTPFTPTIKSLKPVTDYFALSPHDRLYIAVFGTGARATYVRNRRAQNGGKAKYDKEEKEWREIDNKNKISEIMLIMERKKMEKLRLEKEKEKEGEEAREKK